MQAVDRQSVGPRDAGIPASLANRARSDFALRVATVAEWARCPGLIAALVTSVAAGLGDAALTMLRTPAFSRGGATLSVTLFHCTAVMLPFGMLVGLGQEVLLRAASHLPATRAARVFLLAGPWAWIAQNRVLAARVFAVAVGALTTGTLLLECIVHLAARIRDPSLLALALVGVVVTIAIFATFAALVAASTAAWLLRHAPCYASPAVAVVAAGTLFAWPLWNAVQPYLPALAVIGTFGWTLLVGGIALAAINTIAFLSLHASRWFRTRGALVTATTAAGAVGIIALSGATLGRDQTVLSTVLLRSVAARHLVGPLQQLVDRDGDGFGAWFGGGDCDDDDARLHPARFDVPGNGVDENCSGSDAVALGTPATTLADKVLPAATRRASVMFVSIDAVRPDHMSVYGYDRPTTTNLARFAERAVRFTEAHTTSPQSVRSLSAVFTGRHAAGLAWRPDNRFPQLEPSNTTLAEELRALGHATAAFLNTSYFSLTPGFFQGFELVQEGALFKDDERLAVSRAVTWLDERRRNEEPFFAWVHVINPHAPYADRSEPEDFGHDEVDRYDEEIASADASIAPLLEVLDRLERDGQPVLTAVFSDHGEAFGEHGHIHHADCLHDEVLRVPLLVRAPGAPSGEVRALVSLVDLHATALSFVGLARRPGASRSLIDVVNTPEKCRNRPSCVRESLRAEVVPTYGSTAAMRALVVPPWKLIHDLEHGAWELYNRNADRQERRNVYDSSPGRASLLRARLLDAAD